MNRVSVVVADEDLKVEAVVSDGMIVAQFLCGGQQITCIGNEVRFGAAVNTIPDTVVLGLPVLERRDFVQVQHPR